MGMRQECNATEAISSLDLTSYSVDLINDSIMSLLAKVGLQIFDRLFDSVCKKVVFEYYFALMNDQDI